MGVFEWNITCNCYCCIYQQQVSPRVQVVEDFFGLALALAERLQVLEHPPADIAVPGVRPKMMIATRVR